METDAEFFNQLAAEDSGKPAPAASETPNVVQTAEVVAEPTPPASETPNGEQQGNAQQDETPVFELNTEAPAEETPAQPDFNAEFTKRFPGKTYEQVLEELGEVDTLKRKAQAESYRTPLGKSIDELVSKGIPAEIAIQYLSDNSKRPDREFKTLMMKMENPEFTDAEIQQLIDLDYSLGKHAGVEEGDDEATINAKESIGRLKLKRDVAELRKREAEVKANMLKPFETRESVDKEVEANKAEKAEADRKAAWKVKSKEIVSEFKNFKIPFGQKEVGENGKKTKVPIGHFNFKISDELRSQIEQDVNMVVESTKGLVPDEKGVAHIKDRILRLSLLERAFPQMADSLIKFGNSQEREFWSKELNNSTLATGKVFDTGNPTQSEDIYDTLMKINT